jgi:hypothetical protein
MPREWRQAGAQVGAVLILLSIALDLLLKEPFDWQELLWSCYAAALAVALGVFIRSNLLVSSGLVFFAALGMPAWLLGRLLDNQVDPTSILIHALPLLAGALYLSNVTALPRASAAGGWLMHALPLWAAAIFCNPAKNINLANATWPPLARFLPHVWEFHALILAASALTMVLVAYAINHFLTGRAASKPLDKAIARHAA